MSSRYVIETSDEKETIEAGKKLGRVLRRGDIVCLYGDLGAGKTTFVKGIANALGIEEREITSASFVIISEHYGQSHLYHIDLYRVTDNGVTDLGLEEYLDGNGISVVEWAERLKGWDCSFSVYLRFIDDTKREIKIVGASERVGQLQEASI